MLANVCWVEARTSDGAATLAFYQELFGWEEGAGAVGFPYHFLRQAGSTENFGGIATQPADQGPAQSLIYFAVPNLAAALETVTRLGGQLVSPTITMPAGQFAVVRDPQGAHFALYQNA